MWKAIQRSQLEGRKFRRQHSVGNYILDFYCPKEKLAIELDGQDHFTITGSERDSIRDEHLETFNIKVVRFENKEVFENLEGEVEEIKSNFIK